MADRRVRVVVEADEKGDFDGVARGLDRLADDADRANTSLNRYSKGHQTLNAEIKKTAGSVRALRDEFAKSGDLNLLPDLDKQSRTLAKLRGQMSKFGDDVHQSFWSRVFMLGGSSIPNEMIPEMQGLGAKGAAAFGGGFRGIIATFAGPAAIAFGVPLLASLSGVIAGAATGGLGLAAIGTAIVVQLQNPQIRAAGVQLGQELRTKILVATEGLQQPIVDAFRVLSREISPFFADIRRGFDAIAPYVTNLAFRIGEGFAKIGPMIGNALARSGPILGVIANGIEMLIVAVGRFFDEVSKAGSGGAAAMDMIFRGVSGLIVGLGVAVRVGAQLFGVFVTIGTALTGFLAAIPILGKMWEGPASFMKGLAEAADKGTLSSGNFAASLDGLNVSADGAASSLSGTAAQAWSVKGAFDAASGGSIGLMQANLSGHQALTSFSQALDASNGSLDINTEKGQAAMQAALGLRDAAIEVGQKVFEQTHSAAAAAAAIDEYRGAMVTAMVQSGMTEQAAQALTDQLLGIPPDVRTNVTSTAPQASEAVRGHSRDLDLINGKTANTYVINHIATVYTTSGVPVAPRGQAQAAFGTGGIIPAAARGLIANGPVLLGERTVPEAAIPAPNSGISAQRAAGLLGTAAKWWGMDVVSRRSGYGSSVGSGAANARPIVLRLDASGGGSALERAVLDFLTNYISLNGAGNVQSALGRRGAG